MESSFVRRMALAAAGFLLAMNPNRVSADGPQECEAACGRGCAAFCSAAFNMSCNTYGVTWNQSGCSCENITCS